MLLLTWGNVPALDLRFWNALMRIRLVPCARRPFNQDLQFRWRDKPPGFAYVKGQLLIVDPTKLNANPAAHADVGRPVELLGRTFDQHSLDSRRRRYNNGDMPIVVVIIRERGEDFFANKESGLAVR